MRFEESARGLQENSHCSVEGVGHDMAGREKSCFKMSVSWSLKKCGPMDAWPLLWRCSTDSLPQHLGDLYNIEELKHDVLRELVNLALPRMCDELNAQEKGACVGFGGQWCLDAEKVGREHGWQEDA